MASKINEGRARNNYGLYAVGASRAERNGDYQKAADLWCKALVFSRGKLNRHWAEIRMQFCANANHRGWGVPDERAAV